MEIIQNNRINKLLCLSDGPMDKSIFDEFSKRHQVEEYKIIEKSLGKYTGFRILFRHINYFVIAFKGYYYFKKERQSFVLIWQQYIGLYFSIISILDISRCWNKINSKISFHMSSFAFAMI